MREQLTLWFWAGWLLWFGDRRRGLLVWWYYEDPPGPAWSPDKGFQLAQNIQVFSPYY